MFRKNEKHRQTTLFDYAHLLGKYYEAFQRSRGYYFRELMFEQIDENLFACLYSEKKSAPNAPINCMVAALLWQHLNNWTFEELERHMQFDLETRVAIGASADFHYQPFSIRTLFSFKERLSVYESQGGVNLFTKLFNQMTTQQAQDLNIKTNIQRGDSVQLQSNIRQYSRLGLLVEVLQRLYRCLPEAEQQQYDGLFSPYTKGSSDGFVYRLRGSSLAEPLQAIGRVYTALHLALSVTHQENEAFQTFERVYFEHFLPPTTKNEPTSEESTTDTVPIDTKDLGSGILQSPDDLTATYRSKQGKQYRGAVLFANETCHPENKVQLITSVVVSPNNVDDSVIYGQQLAELHRRTPDLAEQHVDAAFGSEDNDIQTQELKIRMVQTAIRGRKSACPMTITTLPTPAEPDNKAENQGNTDPNISIETDQNTTTETDNKTENKTQNTFNYQVQCPNPLQAAVIAVLIRTYYRVDFDLNKCQNCPFFDTCPTKNKRNEQNNTATYKFTASDALRQERHRNIENIPKERQTLRAGVEPLMGQFHTGEKHTGKLRVRGQFNIAFYGIAMSLSINFKRIYTYQMAELAKNAFLSGKNGLFYDKFCLPYKICNQNLFINRLTAKIA